MYHFFRQLWLVLGVKLMEINSNWFSRHNWLYVCSHTIDHLFSQKNPLLPPPIYWCPTTPWPPPYVTIEVHLPTLPLSLPPKPLELFHLGFPGASFSEGLSNRGNNFSTKKRVEKCVPGKKSRTLSVQVGNSEYIIWLIPSLKLT